MLAGVALAGCLCALLAAILGRRTAWPWAIAFAMFLWSLVAVALVTLLPANGAPGFVPAEGRLDSCSWDIGGPAPDGFWILPGGQRLLNAAVFVPSGALLVLTAVRWRRLVWVLVPVGLAGLVGYSLAIEMTQLIVARLDRACDVTDIIDNARGAAIGVLLGIPAAVLARRPLRRRRAVTAT